MTSVRDNLEMFSAYDFRNLSLEDDAAIDAFLGIVFDAAYWGDEPLYIYALAEAFETVSAAQSWLDGIETDIYYLKNFVSHHLDDVEGLRGEYLAFLQAEGAIFDQLSATAEASEPGLIDAFAGFSTAYLATATGLSDSIFETFTDLASINSDRLGEMADTLGDTASLQAVTATLTGVLFGPAVTVVGTAQVLDVVEIVQDFLDFVSNAGTLIATPTGNNAWEAADSLFDSADDITNKIDLLMKSVGIASPGALGPISFFSKILASITDVVKVCQAGIALNEAQAQGTLSEMSQSLANSAGIYQATQIFEGLIDPLFEVVDLLVSGNPTLKTWAEIGQSVFNALIDAGQGLIKGDWLATFHSYNILLGSAGETGIQHLANSYGNLVGDLLTMADSISDGGRWDGGDGQTTNPEFAPSLIEGTDGADTLTGSSAPNTIYGYGGNDTIEGRAGNDTIYGGAGTDRIDGGFGNDVIEGSGNLQGGAGEDTLSGSGLLDGGAGADRITGSGTLIGGDGNDVIAASGISSVDAGADDDTITFNVQGRGVGRSASLSVSGGNGSDHLTIDHTAYSTSSNSGFRISGDWTTLLDQVEEGSIPLSYSFVSQAYYNPGGLRSDPGWTYHYSSISISEDIERVDVIGGASNDSILYTNGLIYDGGDGSDTFIASFADQTADLNWTLDATEVKEIYGVSVTGFEGLYIRLGSGDDAITANGTLFGMNGDDQLTGAGTLDGGEGNDTLTGTGTSDVLLGGDGVDTGVFYGDYTSYVISENSDGSISISGAQGQDILFDIEILEFLSVYGNGSSVARVDIGNVYNWADYTTHYDTNGVIQTNAVSYDDGREALTTYTDGTRSAYSIEDLADVFAWTSIERAYDAEGQSLQNTSTYDDGRTHVTTFTDGVRSQRVATDVDNAHAWETSTVNYDTNGVIQTNAVSYDDGREALTTYTDGTRSAYSIEDLADVFAWTSIERAYDAEGQSLQNTSTYDDGRTHVTTYTDGVRSQRVATDVDNAHAWETSTVNYDTNGVIQTNAVSYDDGREALTTYTDGTRSAYSIEDLADVFAWTSIERAYDAEGQSLQNTSTYDDGRTHVTTFTDGVRSQRVATDVDNAHAWAGTTDIFNTDGDRVSRTMIYDDGREVFTSYVDEFDFI